jgi:lysophospholipase L1-like esterase
VALLEGTLALSLRYPAAFRYLPASFLEPARIVYGGFYRSIIQAEPEFIVHDADLTYTFRPSARFTHRNSEYATDYSTNRLGLRDTDDALERPEVIVLGDSLAAGWGVGQHEAFPKRLETLTALKTLNAGIPSYGTARELKLLDRLDTRGLRHLVVQYSENDFEENARFFLHGSTLAVMSADGFAREQEAYRRARSYFPGKYLIAFAAPEQLARADGGSDAAASPDRTPAWLFLNALVHAGNTDLSALTTVRIWVFELRAFAQNSPDFIETVERERQDPRWPPFVRQIELLSFHERLTAAHAYILDDHLNAEGHDVVARELSDRIRE